MWGKILRFFLNLVFSCSNIISWKRLFPLSCVFTFLKINCQNMCVPISGIYSSPLFHWSIYIDIYLYTSNTLSWLLSFRVNLNISQYEFSNFSLTFKHYLALQSTLHFHISLEEFFIFVALGGKGVPGPRWIPYETSETKISQGKE